MRKKGSPNGMKTRMGMQTRVACLSNGQSPAVRLVFFSVSCKFTSSTRIYCIKDEILMVISCPVDVLWGERGCVMGRAVAPSRGAGLRTAKAPTRRL